MAKTTGNAKDLITFTRASTGTFLGSNGLLQTAAINTPRVEYDANGVAKGLLIEEARTNLVTYSEDFTNASWTKIGSSVSLNATSSPDGSNTADLLTENTANSEHSAYVSIGVSAATETFSAFVKSNGRDWVCLRVSISGAWQALSFQISTNTFGSTTGWDSYASVDMGNGWYRITGTFTNRTNNIVQVQMMDADSSVVYAGDGTSGIYVWGAQLEAGSFPTSYIPTSGATATRSADIASVSVSEFGYNQAQGSVVVEQSVFQTAGNSVAWQIDDGSQSDRYVFNSYNGNTTVIVSNAAQASLTHTGQLADVVYKHGFAWASNDFVSTYDGGAIQSDTSGSLPTVTTVRLGKDAGTSPLNGHIKSINYYPLRLSDAKLQELTS